MLDVRPPGGRHPGGDDDHRERPGHPQREHDLHRRGRQLRPGRPAPAPRPRRPAQAPGVRLPARSTATQADHAERGRSGSRRSRSSPSWGPASRSPCATWRSAAPATSSAREQSGHIAAVGYELYCQLLENAVRQLKHQPPRDAARGERRSAVAGVPAARLRAGPEAADRGLPPAGAAARPEEARRLPPGAARPLRPARRSRPSGCCGTTEIRLSGVGGRSRASTATARTWSSRTATASGRTSWRSGAAAG